MNRRHFLALSAGAASCLVSTPPLRAAAPVRRLKAGFLGGAHSHASAKWRLVRESASYELVGMSEASPSVRASYEGEGATFWSPEALIDACEVVFVESAVADHAVHAKKVLSAGKHAHVEKPPATNLADLEEMVALARRHKLVMQGGYMWRYHPGFGVIFDAVKQGWLGEVYLLRGMIGNQLGAAGRPDWAQFHGGGLFELGAHLIDSMIRLMGEPLSVTPFLRKDGSFPDTLKDNNLAVFQFHKAMGFVLNSNLQPNSGRHRVFEVFGTNGSATLRPIEPATLEIELAKAAGPFKAGLQVVPLRPYTRYVADVADLAACIRGERVLPVTLEEELRVQKWLLKACEMG